MKFAFLFQKWPDHVIRLLCVVFTCLGGSIYFMQLMLLGVERLDRVGRNWLWLTFVVQGLGFIAMFVVLLKRRADYHFRFSIGELLVYTTMIAFTAGALRFVYLWAHN